MSKVRLTKIVSSTNEDYVTKIASLPPHKRPPSPISPMPGKRTNKEYNLQGWNAAKMGFKKEHCPYYPTSTAEKHWKAGHNSLSTKAKTEVAKDLPDKVNHRFAKDHHQMLAEVSEFGRKNDPKKNILYKFHSKVAMHHSNPAKNLLSTKEHGYAETHHLHMLHGIDPVRSPNTFSRHKALIDYHHKRANSAVLANEVVLVPLSTNWLELVVEHHHQIEKLFRMIVATSNDQDIERAFLEKKLTKILVAHSKAEEASIYKWVAKYGMKPEAKELTSEQTEAGELNTKILQDKNKGTDEWLDQVRKLQKAVLHHAKESEEADIFPKLAAKLSVRESTELTKEYKKAFIKEMGAETAAVKDNTHYTWHRYIHHEPTTIHRKGSSHTLKTGDKFGVRHAASDSGKSRVIVHGLPESHVHSLERHEAQSLINKSHKITNPNSKAPDTAPKVEAPSAKHEETPLVDHKYAAEGHARMSMKSLQNGNDDAAYKHDQTSAHHATNGAHKLTPELHKNMADYHNQVYKNTVSKAPDESLKHYHLAQYHKEKALPKAKEQTIGISPEEYKNHVKNGSPITSDEKLHELGQTHLTGDTSHIDSKGKSAIGTWTDSSGYKAINDHLRGVKYNSDAASKAAYLGNAVNGHPLPNSAYVYRGVHKDQAKAIRDLKPGDKYHTKGFTATTIDPRRSTHYGHDVIAMHLPKGHKGLYVSNPKLNNHESERELLLPHNSHFQYSHHEDIHNVPEHDYNGKPTGKTKTVRMHHVVPIEKPHDYEKSKVIGMYKKGY